MARVWDPAKMAKKWQSNFAGAAASWLAGINALSQSPTQLAATPEAMASYAAGCQASVSNGRRLAGLNKIDAATFKSRCQAKQGNLATGAAAGLSRVQTALQNLIPVWQSQRAASQAVGGPKGVNSMAKWQASFQAQMQGVGKSAS